MLLIYVTNFLFAIATTVGMTLIPFLVTDSLGLSLLALGLVEGGAEFVSSLLRLINGILFDKFQSRRFIFVFPTTMAFAAKVLLFIPCSLTIILSMILERMANGAFAAPRDAYVGENAERRGFALGMLGASKYLGCILGPLLVSLVAYFDGGIHGKESLLIAICCVLLLPTLCGSLFLRSKGETALNETFAIRDIGVVFQNTAGLLGLVLVFFLARFNDGLLMMSLKSYDYPEWFYLTTIAIFNTTMMLVSPYIGKKIDQGHLKAMHIASVGSLLGFGVCFYFLKMHSWVIVNLGLIFWGIQRTGTQIVFTAMMFARVKPCQYGTAIGLFYIVSGFGTMLSAFAAGYLAKIGEYQLVFGGCSVLALITLAISPMLTEFGGEPILGEKPAPVLDEAFSKQ